MIVRTKLVGESKVYIDEVQGRCSVGTDNWNSGPLFTRQEALAYLAQLTPASLADDMAYAHSTGEY